MYRTLREIPGCTNNSQLLVYVKCFFDNTVIKLSTSGPVNDDVKDWVEKIIENSTSEIYVYVYVNANKHGACKM